MALFHVARYAGPEAAGAEAEADGRARALLERLQCRARERQRQKQPQRQEAEPTAEAAGRRRRRPRRPRRREGCGAAGSPPEPRGKRRRLDGEAGGAGGAGSGEDAPVDPGGSSPAEGSAPPARGLLLGALGRSRAAKVSGRGGAGGCGPGEPGEPEKRTSQRPTAQPFLPLWLAEPSSVGKSVTEDLVPIEDIPEVHPDMQKKLQAHGISSYFPVQAAVIPTLLESIANGFLVARGGYRPSDLCVSAPTGSGKTLAFVIPVVQALLCRAVCQVRALVVLPTKELAQQVSKVFNIYTDATPLRVALITGQKSLVKEQESLVQKTVDGFRCLADVVVATPGRLVDHIDQTPGFSLQHLRFLIIDEADRMIDSMHQSWLPRVVEAAFPSDVANDPFALLQRRQLQATTAASISCPQMPLQKLLFSATLTQNPEKLQQLGLYQPRLFSTGLAGRGPRDIDRDGESGGKYTFPTGLHVGRCQPSPGHPRDAGSRPYPLSSLRLFPPRLFLLVQAFGGVAAAEFSSRCRPGQRKVVLKQFEQGKIQLLISTDAMARGIDVQGVQLVINYDAPQYLRTYVHRVGRTARAGRTGQAFTLLLKVQERRFLQMLAEAGVPKMARHDIHSELLQPLVPRYEEALSQLEQAVKEERRQKVA
uniref:ATP-dependent RNA helicase n=1 Tax=Canis lupus dingo TaxID=286419 RepID=A0A8C0KBY8_CANLU